MSLIVKHTVTKKIIVAFDLLIIKKKKDPDIYLFVKLPIYCDFIMYKAIVNPQTPDTIYIFLIRINLYPIPST